MWVDKKKFIYTKVKLKVLNFLQFNCKIKKKRKGNKTKTIQSYTDETHFEFHFKAPAVISVMKTVKLLAFR